MALFEVWEVYGEAETHSPGHSMQIAMIYTGYIHKWNVRGALLQNFKALLSCFKAL